MVANQTACSRVEQKFVIKFLLAEKSKPCEIYPRMCIKKYVLVKKEMLTNMLNIVFPW